MGAYKNKTYPLRIDETLMNKIKTIATKEDRPISKQIERMLKDYIERYESKNGTIHIENAKNVITGDNGTIINN